MLTIEDCFDHGVLLLQEQYDFLHHPEERLAVALHGVPDPDRLYIAGPSNIGPVLYQHGWKGQVTDHRGMTAVILPIVIEGGAPEDLHQTFLDNVGDVEATVPYIYGTICNAEPAHDWLDDSVPLPVAPWDLWPIDVSEKHIWEMAAEQAINASALHAIYSYFDNMQNGTEHELAENASEELREEKSDLIHQYRALEAEGLTREDHELQLIITRLTEIEEEERNLGQAQMLQWEQEMISPVTGDPDAQVPPIDLPPEQAAIWRSLQSLSWRNWSTLSKQLDGGVLVGSRFAYTNRRLCPWY